MLILHLNAHTALNVALNGDLASLVRACAVVDKEILGKLQHLDEEHVFNETTLAASTFTHNQDRLLCRQKKLHEISIANRVVSWHYNVLD